MTTKRVEPVTIRKTSLSDLEAVCRIYEEARVFMRDSGNPDQWKGVHPSQEQIISDIEAGLSYVCILDDKVAAVFYFAIENEPTYGKIDGSWLNSDPYGVVHRIAANRSAKGAGGLCLEWCYEQCLNLRIDTHRDNAPMRRLLDKLGFTYCGIVWMENGDERLAFHKVAGCEVRL